MHHTGCTAVAAAGFAAGSVGRVCGLLLAASPGSAGEQLGPAALRELPLQIFSLQLAACLQAVQYHIAGCAGVTRRVCDGCVRVWLLMGHNQGMLLHLV